jgi:toxin FitB
MNLVDTSGWIEYFFAGPDTSFFAEAVEDVEHRIVPTICLYEAF